MRTFFFRKAAATAQLTVSVVFPAPPFWVTNVMTRIVVTNRILVMPLSLLPWRAIGMVSEGQGKQVREDNTIRVSRCKVINKQRVYYSNGVRL